MTVKPSAIRRRDFIRSGLTPMRVEERSLPGLNEGHG